VNYESFFVAEPVLAQVSADDVPRVSPYHPVQKISLCLAASGGGHVRQILDLEPLWRDFPRVFVTEDTALGKSIATLQTTAFVPHFALGQARLGSPFRMLATALKSMVVSARIVFSNRPDVVITTGAGSQLFIVVWARLTGARIILIDSFARFNKPSAFARLAGPLAHVRVAQAAESARHWPGAFMFDPFRRLDGPRPAKKAQLFATVGATLPFPRLVDIVAEANRRGAIPEDVLIQTGTGGARPEGMETVETLPFDVVQETLRDADIVICHGGTGSLITALKAGCRVIAVPRRFALGEHYDDHQAEIVSAFHARGLLEIADTADELVAALARVRTREPVRATTDPSALIEFLRTYIASSQRKLVAPPAL
jgi:UDP-N-acetylglucosamine--N-acetylmuramyl-(pentapeptide) pyrophosphoryl-undecaprenol N-acetylglucosamine transferase